MHYGDENRSPYGGEVIDNFQVPRPNKVVIVLGGYSGAGKDEFFEWLDVHPNYHGLFERYAYADFVKEVLAFGKGITVEELEAKKWEHRPDLIDLAENVIKKNDKLFFPRKFLTELDNYRLKKHIVLTDERHWLSMEYLKKQLALRQVRVLTLYLDANPKFLNKKCGFSLSQKDYDFHYFNTRTTNIIEGLRQNTEFFRELDRHILEAKLWFKK